MDDLNEDNFIELGTKAEQEGRPCIAIFQDADGNWRGATKKFGKWVDVRAGDPQTVLVQLITHDGK